MWGWEQRHDTTLGLLKQQETDEGEEQGAGTGTGLRAGLEFQAQGTRG